MKIDDEAIAKAQEGQTEYWNNLLSRLDFFVTSQFTKKNIEAVVQLDRMTCHWVRADIDKPLADGYEPFARNRMNAILNDHIAFVFNSVYSAVLTQTKNSSTAMTMADYASAGVTAQFKARFP